MFSGLALLIASIFRKWYLRNAGMTIYMISQNTVQTRQHKERNGKLCGLFCPATGQIKAVKKKYLFYIKNFLVSK